MSVSPTAAILALQELRSAMRAVLEAWDESDLENTGSMLATFAWEGEWRLDDNALADALHEFTTALEASRGNFILPDGTDLLSQESADHLELLANAATARQSLAAGEPVTVELLAALAGVAEKTVRMASNPKNAQPLQVTKDGHWTVIAAQDALAWLARRGDFKPTRMGNNQPVLVVSTDIAKALGECIAQLNLTIETLARRAKLDKKGAAALGLLVAGEIASASDALSPSQLKSVASALDFEDPDAFAKTAYQLIALAAANRVIERELGIA